jgi:hypothetical protein
MMHAASGDNRGSCIGLCTIIRDAMLVPLSAISADARAPDASEPSSQQDGDHEKSADDFIQTISPEWQR